MSESYYNTTCESGDQLNLFTKQAQTQESVVFNYYRRVKRSTALDAARALGLHESSVRRSVTNLFHRGLLIKTDEKVIGIYGKNNHLYEFVELK